MVHVKLRSLVGRQILDVDCNEVSLSTGKKYNACQSALEDVCSSDRIMKAQAGKENS